MHYQVLHSQSELCQDERRARCLRGLKFWYSGVRSDDSKALVSQELGNYIKDRQHEVVAA
jgi:hypothetical protein